MLIYYYVDNNENNIMESLIGVYTDIAMMTQIIRSRKGISMKGICLHNLLIKLLMNIMKRNPKMTFEELNNTKDVDAWFCLHLNLSEQRNRLTLTQEGFGKFKIMIERNDETTGTYDVYIDIGTQVVQVGKNQDKKSFSYQEEDIMKDKCGQPCTSFISLNNTTLSTSVDEDVVPEKGLNFIFSAEAFCKMLGYYFMFHGNLSCLQGMMRHMESSRVSMQIFQQDILPFYDIIKSEGYNAFYNELYSDITKKMISNIDTLENLGKIYPDFTHKTEWIFRESSGDSDKANLVDMVLSAQGDNSKAIVYLYMHGLSSLKYPTLETFKVFWDKTTTPAMKQFLVEAIKNQEAELERVHAQELEYTAEQQLILTQYKKKGTTKEEVLVMLDKINNCGTKHVSAEVWQAWLSFLREVSDDNLLRYNELCGLLSNLRYLDKDPKDVAVELSKLKAVFVETEQEPVKTNPEPILVCTNAQSVIFWNNMSARLTAVTAFALQKQHSLLSESSGVYTSSQEQETETDIRESIPVGDMKVLISQLQELVRKTEAVQSMEVVAIPFS